AGGRIAEHLDAVVKQEGLKADPELVQAVARLANGSMRDGLSLLDRLMAAGEKTLSVDLLERLLGLPPRELVGHLIDAAADGDARLALESADALLDQGVSIDQLLETLMDRLRDCMVLCACGPETELVELSGNARQSEVERSQRFDAAGLTHMIALCESVQRAVKSSPVPRALLDALVVRLAMTEKLADVTALARELAGGPSASGSSPKKV
ncbi:MAG: hypothetical protein AAGK04_09830, partial [Planctomycetota bacterium]